MIIVETLASLEAHIGKMADYQRSSGFVPTMGALHEGHLSLIAESKKENRYTVCSVFVNPTQFNDPKDFEKYPITIEADLKALEGAGCDLVFLPSVKEMYTEGTANLEHYELGEIENRLEGFFRPGHFQGVCQVVYRLLKAVHPKVLYLGQKDFQQVMVITKMIELTGLEVDVKTVPTKREANGLAMSSRNERLTAEQREKAAAIHEQLLMIKKEWGTVAPEQLIKTATENLLKAGFDKVEYISIAEPASLKPIESADQSKEVVALVAAFMGPVRLIDNMIIR